MGDDVHSRHRVEAWPGYGTRLPLTEAQAEKWLGGRYSEAAALAFGEGVELHFTGALDAAALAQAFAEVTERHQALAMRFEPDGSAQVYEPPSGIVLHRLDFRGKPAADYAAFRTRRTREPFDPARPPLVRAWLCHLDDAHWRLLLCAHHLVIDGWSLRVVLQDLAAHYNRGRGGDARLPPVDPWAGYVAAERARRDGEAGRASLAYWLARYRTLPEPLRLPTDRPRRAPLSFAARTHAQAVPDALWRRLRETARALGTTRFGLLLAGYAALLHRLSGQCDLVCGVPFAGAARGAGARVVGDTDNTLPLRIAVDPDEPAAALVRRVHAAMQDAAAHQDVSLGRIVRALPLAREPGRLLLVDSILSLNPAIERLRFDGVDCRLRVLPHRAAAWELAWQWRPLAEGVVLEVQYHSDLYLPATIRAWSEAYLALLADMADDAATPVAELGGRTLRARGPEAGWALISAAPREEAAASLCDLLDEALLRFAPRCAARCGEDAADYAALDRRSRAVAAALRARGVAPGQLVGLCLGRSLDMLVAVLGVLRCGAAYVPLDPAFPHERLRWMATQAGLAYVVAARAQTLPDGLAEGRSVLAIEDLHAGDADAPLPRVSAEALAYVLYTSGSTGAPKGVRILHRNLVNFLRAMRQAPGLAADDVLCAATMLSFDIAALELYLPLLCGAQVVIADDEEHRDPEALARLIARRGCTVLQTTPSLLALLREVGRDDALRPLTLLVGGEAFPPALARALRGRCRALWNLYGPTETTVWSTVARLDAAADGAAPAAGAADESAAEADAEIDIDIDIDDDADTGAEDVDDDALPLGAPIADTRIYLLDAQRRPVLPGALGEIWIGGGGVADGYLHRPDLSAERFLADPFAGDGGRMYRTGDLGRIRDGRLYFHGRADDQIKLRGYRIEPAEIEAAAAAEPAVRHCAAVARAAGNGDQVLVLYVAADAEPEALAARLRARLAADLPAYMRPQHVVVLPALPQTANGKLDRRALPAPSAADVAAAAQRRAPGDALERELHAIWCRLLQRPELGIDDNFFELGGYSLLAVRMFAELHQRHGVALPLSTLIAHPTVATLAAALRERKREAEPAPGERAARDAVPAGGAAAVSAQADRVLVELRAGEGAPLFLIHAVGGHVLNYVAIARALPPGRPVVGLQSPGFDGAEPPLTAIEAMAARYAAAIRRRCPDGPYLLAGGSMGGVLALEAARALQAQGGEIAFLGMFDTTRPGAPGWAGHSPWRPHRWWSLYRGLDGAQRAALRRRIGFRLWWLPALRLRRWLGGAATGATPALRRHLVEAANHGALAAYRPQRYRGRIVLFRATQAGGDPTLGWQDVADGVEVVTLSGRHDNIIEQPELALQLRRRLETL